MIAAAVDGGIIFYDGAGGGKPYNIIAGGGASAPAYCIMGINGSICCGIGSNYWFC